MADTTKKKNLDANEVIAVGESDISLNGTDAVTDANNKAADWQAQSDAYSKQADTYLENYANGGNFSYDFNVDPVFQAAKQAYERSAKLAAEDVQGRAAALSGGYSNSYGATAAQQAYNQSIDNLYDTIPELEAAAYNRYQNEQQKNLTLYDAYQNKADSAENKASNAENKAYTYALQLAELGQYDKLSDFLGVDLSAVQQDADMQKALEFALTTGDLSQLEKYGINTEYLNRALNSEWAQLQAQFGDYSGLENLGIDTSEYQNNIAQEKALNDALQRAQIGDYSGLKKLGYDTSYVEQKKTLEDALQRAQFGDYSGLEALGYDMSTQNKKDTLTWAQVAAEAGDYSLLKELGIDTSALEYDRDLTNALQLAQVGDYSGLKKLGINVKVSSGSGTGGSDGGGGGDDTGKLTDSQIATKAKTIKNNFLGNYDPDYDATGDLKTGEINAFNAALIDAAYDSDTVDKLLLQAGIPDYRIDALWEYSVTGKQPVKKEDNGNKKPVYTPPASQPEGLETDDARKEKIALMKR